MTKDWGTVQEEIRELSFSQKKPLEEVKELMERKYSFHASTRAYRMKLKEWGLMRHKPRKRQRTSRARSVHSDGEDSSGTVELPSAVNPPGGTCEQKEWQNTIVTSQVTEPTFMSLLRRSPNLETTGDPWMEAHTSTPKVVLDMLGAILDHDSQRLEGLIVDNFGHVNDPLGLPFDTPDSRFFGHCVLDHMAVLQHPNQTLFDIACGMPCGPVIWVLLAHGAKGSTHPLGTDLALHNAIKNGRSYTVQALLMPGRSNVNGLPGTAWKPLMQAVFWNVPDVVNILLGRGANIHDMGPSATGTEPQTALQLCLQNRANNYKNLELRKRGNHILRMLMDAEVDIAATRAGGITQSTFEAFVQPWHTYPYWATTIESHELHCLQVFLSKSLVPLETFGGYPCESPNGKSFEHQILWHSTSSVARLAIDSCASIPNGNGSVFLHEILGTCPNTKRHPSDTLRDIEVLLNKGVDPNVADVNGLTPLRKCIDCCPAVDLVARLQMLLQGGADPEAEDGQGKQPYVIAARLFDSGLLSDEALQALISKMQGRSVRGTDGMTYDWPEGYFPISDTQTYDRVISCSRSTGDFIRNIRNVVPDDIQEIFQRAYFAVVSKNYFNSMAQIAKSIRLEDRDKKDIFQVMSTRKGVDLPDHRFDQELVMALLDCEPISSTSLDTDMEHTPPITSLTNDETGFSSASDSLTLSTSAATPAAHSAHPLFRFNSRESTTSQSATHLPSQQSESSFDDEFIPLTTQIRWRYLHVKSKSGDLAKAAAAILCHLCEVCSDGNLLTKRELESHTVEHAHTGACEESNCMRRFCAKKRTVVRAEGCQDHLFAS